MKTNGFGRAIIKQCEGCRLIAYRDSGGVWTIGYGSTRGVKPGMQITAEQAERRFEEDLAAAEFVVRRLVSRGIGENRFSALVSFAYNVPFKEFRSSALLRLVNAGDFEAAAQEFHRWVFDNGRKLPGLIRRRLLEVNLFHTPDGSAPAA